MIKFNSRVPLAAQVRSASVQAATSNVVASYTGSVLEGMDGPRPQKRAHVAQGLPYGGGCMYYLGDGQF